MSCDVTSRPCSAATGARSHGARVEVELVDMLASEERVALVVCERSGELQAHSMSRALSTETSGRRWPSWCSARANWVMPASRSARSWTWLDATAAPHSPQRDRL